MPRLPQRLGFVTESGLPPRTTSTPSFHRLSRISIEPVKESWGNEKPRLAGLCKERMMGLEPTTFCMASRRSSQLSYIRPARRV